MHQVIHAVTADALACFQLYPGLEADSIINLSGIRVDGIQDPVKPHQNGYFAFRMAPDGSCTARAFDTVYTIKHVSTESLEAAPAQGFQFTAWTVLGSMTDADRTKKIAAIQRRLQILGYYTGRVDGVTGPKTERAILGFQADYELRSDGIVGAITRQKLDEEVNKCKSGNAYILHRPLIRFTRAPSPDYRVDSGRPFSVAPQVDDRGSKKVNSMGFSLRGPVVAMARETEFRVKVMREFIADRATLTVVSGDPNLVEIIDSVLPQQQKMILRLKTKSPGSTPSTTWVQVRHKIGTTEIPLATLNIVVLPLIVRKARPYWVTIEDASGTTTTAPPGARADLQQVFDVVEHILWPYGIRFRFLSWREKTVRLHTAGTLRWADINNEFDRMVKAPDSAGNSEEKGVINVYIVNTITDAIGVAYSRFLYPEPIANGIALTRNPDGLIAMGNDLAHEIGHMMGLVDGYSVQSGGTRRDHVDDDPSDTDKKTDLWTLRRLMFAYNPTQNVRAEAWSHDAGFGNFHRGAEISLRHLPKDKTDDECRKARDATRTNRIFQP